MDDLDRPLTSRESQVMAHLLAAVERDSQVTQRSLSKELGIALGLANAYLKRCVHKGLIKVRQVPLNRYAYYLTPHGFAEKSRLTARYLTDSFNLFHDARQQYAEIFRQCGGRAWVRVALVGHSELAEIAVLSAGDGPARVVCVIDPNGGPRCAGRPVVADLDQALALETGLDVLVISDLRNPQAVFDEAVRQASAENLGAERVLAPGLLNISRTPQWEGVAE